MNQRFLIVQTEYNNSPLILRLDTQTGKTWYLFMNPQKVEWGPVTESAPPA
jgi:hypothetical protein